MRMVIYLLAAYGIMFGIQNKFVSIRYWKITDLLECPYCLGFWTGWVVWGISWWTTPVLGNHLSEGMVWALASAGACQFIEDLLLRGRG